MCDTQDLELLYREEIKKYIQERLAIIDNIEDKYQRYLCLRGIGEVVSDLTLDILKETQDMKRKMYGSIKTI